MKRIVFLVVTLLVALSSIADNKLDLKDITSGKFRAESMPMVKPLNDGESYAQLSSDGKRIVSFSFKTGQETGVLFDVTSANGAKINDIDGFIVSPDGQRLLIQTNTKRIYRHSFTASYYIYTIRQQPSSPSFRKWSPAGSTILSGWSADSFCT